MGASFLPPLAEQRWICFPYLTAAPSCTLDLPSLMAEGGYTLDAAAAAELASRPAAADPEAYVQRDLKAIGARPPTSGRAAQSRGSRKRGARAGPAAATAAAATAAAGADTRPSPAKKARGGRGAAAAAAARRRRRRRVPRARRERTAPGRRR